MRKEMCYWGAGIVNNLLSCQVIRVRFVVRQCWRWASARAARSQSDRNNIYGVCHIKSKERFANVVHFYGYDYCYCSVTRRLRQRFSTPLSLSLSAHHAIFIHFYLFVKTKLTVTLNFFISFLHRCTQSKTLSSAQRLFWSRDNERFMIWCPFLFRTTLDISSLRVTNVKTKNEYSFQHQLRTEPKLNEEKEQKQNHSTQLCERHQPEGHLNSCVSGNGRMDVKIIMKIEKHKNEKTTHNKWNANAVNAVCVCV